MTVDGKRVIFSIGDLITAHWPSDWIELPTEALSAVDTALDWIGLDATFSDTEWSNNRFMTRHRVLLLNPVRLPLPLISGMSVGLGAGADALPFFDVQLGSQSPHISIGHIDFNLHVPPNILQAWSYDTTTSQWSKEGDGYDFVWSTGLKATLGGSVEFTVARPIGFDPNNPPSEEARPPPAMIADTGVLLQLSGVAIAMPGAPEGMVLDYVLPAGFKGIIVDNVEVRYIKDGSSQFPPIGAEQLAIGSGGVSGRLLLGARERSEETFADNILNHWCRPDAVENESGGPPPSPMPDEFASVDLAGFTTLLQLFSVSFEQSVPTASQLTGHLFMPMSNRWFQFTASLGGPDGDFLLELGGAGGEGLISFENDWLDIDAESIRYFVKDGVHYAAIDGSVRLKKPDNIDWPSLKVENLQISSAGDIEFEGGWLDLEEGKTLDFKGFKVQIEKLGFGTEAGESPDETGAIPKYRWIGFSGGISLVEGIPLSASVEGLKIRLPVAPTEGEPEVSLEGIAIELTIPNTFELSGHVRYEKISPDGDNPYGDLRGDLFIGGIRLDFISLKLRIEGEILIGRVETADGRNITAFYVSFDSDLPSIPIGATGTALNGIQALFGAHVGPNRMFGGSEPLPWYEWYKREIDGDANTRRNVRSVKKYTILPDHWAFGAGVLIGTAFDGGHTLNVRALVVVTLPGPVIMFEGQANLLKKAEGGMQETGAFYCFAVFDGLAQTFQINVDVRFVLSKVVEVGGGLEAFFDFDDSMGWYVHLGKKEPRDKRIRAKVLEIITADNYMMIDPHAFAFGADTGVEWRGEYGPITITLVARFYFDAHIAWNPEFYEGDIGLEGGVALKLFGIGLELLFGVSLEGQAPQPWWIHGEAYIKLTLPWPLPDVEADVSFEWGEDEPVPSVDPIVTAAKLMHHKASDVMWEMLVAESENPSQAELQQILRTAPVVPLDATPVVAYSRPVFGSDLPEPTIDAIDEFEFRYAAGTIELHAIGQEPPLAMSSELSDFAGLIRFGYDNIVNRETDPQQPEIKLWHYDHFEHRSPHALATLPASLPACLPVFEVPFTCVEWGKDTLGGIEERTLRRDLLSLETPLSVESPTITDGQLHVHGAISIRFDEPLAEVVITFSEQSTPSIVRAIHRGRTVVERSPDGDGVVRLRARAQDKAFDGVIIEPLENLPERYRKVVIQSICWRTRLDAHDAEPPGIDPMGNSPSGEVRLNLPLQPFQLYRLDVTPSREFRHTGASDDWTRDEAHPSGRKRSFYFQTGGPPGTDYAVDAPDLLESLRRAPDSAEEGRMEAGVAPSHTDLSTHVLNTLTPYVAHSTPDHGTEFAYHGYDVALVFNVAYAADFYPDDLSFRISPRNAKPDTRESTEARWVLPGTHPLLSVGLLTRLLVHQQDGCKTTDSAPIPRAPELRGTLSSMKARQLYACEVLAKINGYERTVHRFQFTTSKFATATDHFLSGGSSIRLRRAPTGAMPDLDWIDDHLRFEARWRDALRVLRERSPSSAPESIADATAEAKAAFRALDEQCCKRFEEMGDVLERRFADSERHKEAGLTRRGLPPVIEMISFPYLRTVLGRKTLLSIVMLESPEPIDWKRLSVECSPRDETPLPIQVIWNCDRTRAIFTTGKEGFPIGKYDWTFVYDGGGEMRPDIPVLTATEPTDTGPVRKTVHETVNLELELA